MKALTPEGLCVEGYAGKQRCTRPGDQTQKRERVEGYLGGREVFWFTGATSVTFLGIHEDESLWEGRKFGTELRKVWNTVTLLIS